PLQGLVCVTQRPNEAKDVGLTETTDSTWFDRAATTSQARAASPPDPDRDDAKFDPARACYRFSAKVWRTRPDLTNLSLPFKLNFESGVRLVSYQKLGS